MNINAVCYKVWVEFTGCKFTSSRVHMFTS
jgi:hypothetical protein